MENRNKAVLEDILKWLEGAELSRAEPDVGIMSDGYYIGGMSADEYNVIKSLVEDALDKPVPAPVADLETLKRETLSHFARTNISYRADDVINYLNERGLIQPVEKIEGLDEAISLYDNQVMPLRGDRKWLDPIVSAAKAHAAMQRQS